MRAAMARPNPGAAPGGSSDIARRTLCPGPLPARQGAHDDRTRAGIRDLRSISHPAAPSVLAQRRLAEAQSLVRERSATGAARSGAAPALGSRVGPVRQFPAGADEVAGI